MLFQKLSGKVAATFRERYPWFRSSSFKIASYRTYLDGIAGELSTRRSLLVKTRFNRKGRCAELYAGHKVLARVYVRGGVFFDGDMIVEGVLSDDEKRLFNEIPLTMQFRSR